MKFSKLTLAIAATLSVSASFNAFAIELYVDTKTKQIYAEPGRGRELMGSFQKVDDAPAKTVAPAAPAEISAMKQDLELKTNEIKALQEHAAEASGPTVAHVKLDDGIHFATKDGNFTAAINGRMQVDSQSNINQGLNNDFLTGSTVAAGGGSLPATLNDGATLRRARLGLEGTFFKNTGYKFEYDFARGNGSTASGITDAYISYAFTKPFQVKFGAFKEPFSLEEATSNRYTTFIERNMAVNTFVDNFNTYKVGVGAFYSQDRWQAATSLQTEGIGAYSNMTSATGAQGGVNRSGGAGDTGWEVNARVTGMPWMESKTKFWHLGGSGSYINVNNNYTSNGMYNNGGLIFANGIGNNVDRSAILNTGNLTSGQQGLATSTQANSFTRFGAETAVVYGPFSAQSEYIQANISGPGYHNPSLNGYYGYMTYFLTGESRNYKSKTGSWDRIKPNHNFDMKGGWGAWELATGYDNMDLNSGGVINGGRASTAKFGINWYPNSHVRVMTNWVHALDISTSTACITCGVNSGTNTVSTSAALAGNTSRAFNGATLDMLETRIQLDW
ncbi:MAG: porin [Methylococcaceae bacterium]